VRQAYQYEGLVHDMSSASSGNANGGAKYFLYIPVWATTQEPSDSGQSGSQSETTGSTESATSMMSSDDPPSSSDSGGGGTSGGGGSSGGGGTGSGGTGPGGTGPGGTGPGGTGPGGTGPGGTGPGGTGPGGTPPSGSNCLLHGTLITMTDGRRVPIELLAPGDMVASLVVPGLKTDVPFKAQYEWMSTWGLAGATVKSARVATVTLGEHEGFVLINGRVKATPEHPFLIRRTSDDQDAWGFCSAELLRVGDRLVVPDAAGAELAEEPVFAVESIDGRVKTVAIHVPGANTYLADGVWTHNDSGPLFTVASSTSASESSGSSSGSKSSGSSFSSSSGSPAPSLASSLEPGG